MSEQVWEPPRSDVTVEDVKRVLEVGRLLISALTPEELAALPEEVERWKAGAEPVYKLDHCSTDDSPHESSEPALRTHEDSQWHFTDKLRHWVKLRRISRRCLTERSNLDSAYVHRLITGERRNPSPLTVVKLSLGLGLTSMEVDRLLDAAGHPSLADLLASIF